MKNQKGSGQAKVVDYRSGSKTRGKEVMVDYTFDFDQLENREELDSQYAFADLLALANQRIKQTANSAARQEAVKPYALDPNSQEAIRQNLIDGYVKAGIDKNQAEQLVDGALASLAK